MGSKILFNTVFINLEQVVHFLLCSFQTKMRAAEAAKCLFLTKRVFDTQNYVKSFGFLVSHLGDSEKRQKPCIDWISHL